MLNFLSYLHSSAVASDLRWALVVAAACLALADDSVSASPRYAWREGFFLISLVITALIVLRRATYVRQRTGWLALAKVLGFLALSSPMQQRMGLLPKSLLPEAGPPTSKLLQLVVLCEEGLLLFLGALGWRLPLRAHLYVQAVGLLTKLSTLPQQCLARCAHPGYEGLYESWAIWLTQACSRVFPFTVAARRDGLVPHPCIAVHSWVLLVLGYMLPSLYVQWSQCQLRRTYLRETGQGPDVPPSEPWVHAWVHLGMAVACVPIMWRAVEVAGTFWRLMHL